MGIVAVKATKMSSTSGNSVTASVTATAGNALIVGGAGYEDATHGQTYTVTRTGDTYTTDTSGDSSAAGSGSNTGGIASAPNCAGGAVNMTISVPLSNGINGVALELSGLPTSSIRDAASPAIKRGTSTSASSNTLANVTRDVVYCAFVMTEYGSDPATVTAGTGWTQVVGAVTMTELRGNAYSVLGLEYQIVSEWSASKAGAWTIDNVNWAGQIAMYKQAPAKAPVLPRASRWKSYTTWRVT